MCCQFLRKHRKESTGRNSPPISVATVSGNSPDDKGVAAFQAQDEAVSARKELAKKQREKAMEQMQNMQRRFLEKNKEQLLDLQTSSGEDQV